jgi:hypothetical protein
MNRVILSLLGVFFVSAAYAQTPTPIVPTPASVAASNQAIILELPAGASISQGDLLYIDTNNTAKLADADGGSATAADVRCLSLTSAASGQRVRCVAYDPALTIAQTVAAGELYVLSGVAGRMSTAASIISGNYATVVGIGISTSKIFFNPISSGVAL